MLDKEAITQQLELLATHRRTLAYLLDQATAYGGITSAPPQTANGIAEACANIARIKEALREGRVPVEDEPNDEALPQVEPVQQAGGDTVGGDKITVGDITGSTSIAIGAGAQATTIIQQRPDPALHQLRAPVTDFVGREREIDQLVQALRQAADNGGAAAISGVRGMAGIGKSELAYVVANRLKDAFPDAQLLIELRGASSSSLSSEQALQTVIYAFEREAKLPDDVGRLKGLYNSVLAGKRALILADDAKDAAQVRLLLPPPGCALLVTSRNRFSLPGMVALDLEMLAPEEAEKLLLQICPRIGGYAGELAELCGYLPLALRVSASLLKENDIREVARYVEQLRAERLRHLADPDNPDDPQASVEGSLRLSYDALEPAVRDALCQMCYIGADFDLEIATRVVVADCQIEEVLELLHRRSLVDWDEELEWYSIHDLIQDFGRKQRGLDSELMKRLSEINLLGALIGRLRVMRGLTGEEFFRKLIETISRDVEHKPALRPGFNREVDQ